MNVTIFGLGYVGSVTAACLAQGGHRVTGVDPVQSKVEAILAGEPPVAEPGLGDLMRAGIAAGRLTATSDTDAALAGADVALICVGTPSGPTGALATHFVEQVADQIAAHLEAADPERALVVAFRSTMLPGTTTRIVRDHLPQALEGSDRPNVHHAFVPEFLREATAIDDFYNPPFSVVGTGSADALDALAELVREVRAPLKHVDVEAAEALKYACNAFHAVKVTFANEMGRFCESVGLDAVDMMRLFASDEILNVSSKYLRPGFAFGGSCLPKDVRAIAHHARRNDIDLPLIDSLLASNAAQVDRTVRHVLAQGWREVALLGLTFKSGTDDLRESPYVELAERLLAKGITLRIHDANIVPERVMGSNLQFVQSHLPHIWRMLRNSADEAVADADVVLIGSETDAGTLAAAAASGRPVLATNDSAVFWPVAQPVSA